MRIALGLLTAACSVVVLHCSAGLPYVCHGAVECGLEPDGGPEGGPDAQPDVVPSGCDPEAAPKDAPACVVNTFAVFVDGTAGADTNEGTKESPVKSIGVALTKLGSRSRVYVCQGTYAESVEITKTVSLFGGLACDWKTPGASSPKWTGAKPEFALRIAGVPDRITIDSFDITAKDGSKPGDSSIGVFVADSKDVVFSNVQVVAAHGIDGTSPLQKAVAANAPKALAAVSPPNINGSAGAKNTCTDGDSLGGIGGTVGANDATAGTPALGGGQPGPIGTDCAAGGTGLAGSPGAKGDEGAPLTALGALSNAAWTPSAGGQGKTATRAQGGGGGGSRTGAGGGGGAGGCGGTGGDPGGGGGASLALVVVASKVSVKATRLTGGQAGAGGSGAAGQLGQPPGGGGGGATVAAGFDGCAGGQGGQGGQGGAGGGGAGGLAPAVLTKAGASFIKDDASTLTPGTPGAKGKGAGALNDGPAAPAAATLEIQ